VNHPIPNDPNDESDLPWDDEEDLWDEDEPPPPGPSSEDDSWDSFFKGFQDECAGRAARFSPLEDLEDEETGEPFLEPVEEEPDDSAAPFASFTEIPAWQETHRYALQIAQLGRSVPVPLRRHPALVNLRRLSYLAAVDIAYGHDEGYSAGTRGRHLERCRQGLKRLHLCLSLVETVRMLGVLSPPAQRSLFDQTIQVRDRLVHWMEQVRHA